MVDSAAMTELRVEVTDEFLSTLVHDPVTGLTELIDNALDADADEINVEFQRSPLGAPSTVVVTDNGTGMTSEEAANLFRPLGKSWKRQEKVGPRGRLRRGRRGRGRFAAYAIGGRVVWTTTATAAPPPMDANDSPTLSTVTITGDASDLERFDLSAPYRADDADGTRTVVTITQVGANVGKLESQSTRTKLVNTYALYLARQRSLRIVVDGLALDPARAQAGSFSRPLVIDAELDGAPQSVQIVEWSPKVAVGKPLLVLRDGNGDALLDVPVLPTGAVPYTAYVDWAGFADRTSTLVLADSDQGEVGMVVRAAIAAVSEWLDQRGRQARSEVIEDWKAEQSYPYQAGPATVIEEVERDVFDLIATAAAPVLAAGTPKSRRLSLRLIQEALRRDPSDVTNVLSQVLNLPAKDLADLNELLRRTSLPNLIATSRAVQDRLRVLETLDVLMSASKPTRGVLEQPVHQIAAAEPWLFGDSYALTLSEKGLTAVLAAHRKLLGDPVMIDEPETVVQVDGHTARVDVLLSRAASNSDVSRENLVVEIKRPGLPIGFDETAQIQKYAYTVAGDERFRDQTIRWDFLIIGSTIDPLAAMQADARTGVITDKGGVRVRMTSWDTLIHTCRHRLRFLTDTLDLAGDSPAVLQLRNVHDDVVARPPAEQPADTDSSDSRDTGVTDQSEEES